MLIKRFDLTSDQRVTLDVYILDASPEMPLSYKKPFMVVCPGGGYCALSDREAEPIAMAYSAAGFNTAVLRYSVGTYAKFPTPLSELSKSIKLIREHAQEWYTDPDKIAVVGFSAGGHLVASLGAHWNLPEVMEASGCYDGENKPNALVLGYPVILGEGPTHEGTINTAIGNDITDTEERAARRNLLSLDKHIGQHTPPSFIFHTYSDHAVPVECALAYASAMAQNNRPFELHVFQQGEHGLALANNITYNSVYNLNKDAEIWVRLSTEWLWNLFGRQIPNPPYPTVENRI